MLAPQIEAGTTGNVQIGGSNLASLGQDLKESWNVRYCVANVVDEPVAVGKVLHRQG